MKGEAIAGRDLRATTPPKGPRLLFRLQALYKVEVRVGYVGGF
jgi:hypothetical protein